MNREQLFLICVSVSIAGLILLNSISQQTIRVPIQALDSFDGKTVEIIGQVSSSYTSQASFCIIVCASSYCARAVVSHPLNVVQPSSDTNIFALAKGTWVKIRGKVSSASSSDSRSVPSIFVSSIEVLS